jgi:hypothetical protein
MNNPPLSTWTLKDQLENACSRHARLDSCLMLCGALSGRLLLGLWT